MKILLFALALLSAPAMVLAAPSDWAAQPSSEALTRAWPKRADQRPIPGRAAIRCQVDAGGVLSRCQVVAETPSGAGAGLLSLAPLYRLKPERIKAVAADGNVVVVADREEERASHPSWRRKPTAEDLLVVYPNEAMRKGQSGRAVINCLIAPQGGAYDCLVLEEAPAGAHFGAAALALTPQFVFEPAMRNGTPVFTSVTIPINFKWPEGAHAETAEPYLTNPIVSAAMAWLHAPTSSDVAAAYPAEGRAAGRSGHAALDCGFAKTGALRDCRIVSEAPSRQGFGRAAQEIAKQFRLDLASLPWEQVHSARVTLPITFATAALSSAGAVGKPVWTKMPDGEALAAAMKKIKPGAGSGRAIIRCKVKQGGDLEGCVVASETPEGVGMGAAALALQPSFRMAAWSDEGLPVVGQTVEAPIRFKFEGEPAQALKP